MNTHTQKDESNLEHLLRLHAFAFSACLHLSTLLLKKRSKIKYSLSLIKGKLKLAQQVSQTFDIILACYIYKYAVWSRGDEQGEW